MAKVSPGTVKNRLKSLQIEYYSSHRLSKMSIHNLQRSLLKSSEFLKSSLSIKHFIIRRFWFMKNTALRAGNSNSRAITFKKQGTRKILYGIFGKMQISGCLSSGSEVLFGFYRVSRSTLAIRN